MAFFCQECGHKFRSGSSAERAYFGSGCPKCGGTDIDEGESSPSSPEPVVEETVSTRLASLTERYRLRAANCSDVHQRNLAAIFLEELQWIQGGGAA